MIFLALQIFVNFFLQLVFARLNVENQKKKKNKGIWGTFVYNIWYV